VSGDSYQRALEMRAAAAGLLGSAPVPETSAVPGSGSAVPGSGATVSNTAVPAVPTRDSGTGNASGGFDGLTKWQIAAALSTVAVAVAVFVYGAAGSYNSVWNLAVEHHVPLPRLVPLGVDGGLVLAVLTDIVVTWIGQPLWWLRIATRGFVSGSVAANAAAGWPDPIAVFLHCFAPVIVLLVTEAGRAALLRKHAEADGRDPIPLARWFASPLATPALWRRMALWGVKSYAKAVTAEVSRRQAIMQLQQHYGHRWRKAAPGDLVWLLKTGNRLEEACARVAAMTAPQDGTGNPGTRAGRGKKAGTGSRSTGTRSRSGTGKHSGNRGHGNPRGSRGTGTGAGWPGNRAAAAPDPVLLADVARRIAEHRERHGREITVAELAIALGRRKAVAGELLRAARAQGNQEDSAVEAQR
jgi:hypothetical protein